MNVKRLLVLLLTPLLPLAHSMTIMNPSSAAVSSSSSTSPVTAATNTAAALSSSFRIRPSIILFGDSITQQAFGVDNQATGWASLLAAAYSRRADVFNRGFSGYNTQWAVDRLLTRVFGNANNNNDSSSCTTTTSAKKKSSSNDISMHGGVIFCTVFFGANDAALPGQRQHVPIDQYQQNLVTIIQHIQSSLSSSSSVYHNNNSCGQEQQDLVILLLTPPPFDADAWMAHKGIDSPGRSNDVAKEYGDRVKLVAKQINDENENIDATATTTVKCAVIDTWTLLQGCSNDDKECYSQYLSDGLHLNTAGNRIVYEAIMDVLQHDFPNIAPRPENGIKIGLPLEEPMWDELC